MFFIVINDIIILDLQVWIQLWQYWPVPLILCLTEYSNILIVSAFSNSYFSRATYSPIKNSYLQLYPRDKAEILVNWLNCIELCFAQFSYWMF